MSVANAKSVDSAHRKRTCPVQKHFGRKRTLDGDDPRNPATWRDKEWSQAFNKLKHDSGVHTDDLTKLLEFAGNLHPQPRLVKAVMEDLCAGKTTLSAAECHRFIHVYEEERDKAMHDAFEKMSEDAEHPTLDVNKVCRIFKNLGYVTLPSAIAEVMLDAQHDCGLDVPRYPTVAEKKAATVTAEAFERMGVLMELNDGFCRREIDQLQKAFSRFDVDKSGVMEACELQQALAWLNVSAEQGVLEKLFVAAEKETSGSIDFDTFVNIMRKHREVECLHIFELFLSFDSDNDQQLTIGEVFRMCRWMGWSLLPNTLLEALEEVECHDCDKIAFDDFWTALNLLRQRQGFSRSEAEVVSRTFSGLANHDEEMSTAKLELALNQLGHGSSVGSLGKSAKSVEAPRRGTLYEPEFFSFVRSHREAEMSAIREAFREHAENRGAGILKQSKLMTALNKLNCFYMDDVTGVLRKELPLSIFSKKDLDLDFDDFRRIIQGCRRKVQDRLKKNLNFHEAEIAKFRIAFTAHCPDGTGVLPPAVIAKVFASLFPLIKTSGKIRDHLKQTLAKHKKLSSNGLDWPGFVIVMRTYDDLRQKDMEAREAAAVTALCHSKGAKGKQARAKSKPKAADDVDKTIVGEATGAGAEEHVREAFRIHERDGIEGLTAANLAAMCSYMASLKPEEALRSKEQLLQKCKDKPFIAVAKELQKIGEGIRDAREVRRAGKEAATKAKGAEEPSLQDQLPSLLKKNAFRTDES